MVSVVWAGECQGVQSPFYQFKPIIYYYQFFLFRSPRPYEPTYSSTQPLPTFAFKSPRFCRCIGLNDIILPICVLRCHYNLIWEINNIQHVLYNAFFQYYGYPIFVVRNVCSRMLHIIVFKKTLPSSRPLYVSDT